MIHNRLFFICNYLNTLIASFNTNDNHFCRAQENESSSEFSFTSSLMEALDGQGKKVHFAGVQKY